MKLKFLPVRGDEYLEEVNEELMVDEVTAILRGKPQPVKSSALLAQGLVMLVAERSLDEEHPINIRAWEIADTQEPILGLVLIGRRNPNYPWSCGEYLPK